MKRNIAIFLVILIVAVPIAIRTRQFIKRASTFDTIGAITVAMSKTLTIESWSKGYDVVGETHSMFPEVETKQGAIVDAWNNPIRIEIHRLAKSFSVRIVSAGMDEQFGTSDDCVRELEIEDK
jgi:hypothetical protein